MIIAGSRTNTYEQLSKHSAELAPLTQEQIDKAKPKTWVQGGGKKKDFFGDKKRDPELLKKYKNIMEQGGLVSTGLELYPLFILANGYKCVGDKNGEIQEWLDSINFTSILWQGITDAIWAGDAFQENVGTRGNGGDIITLAPRDPIDFNIDFSEQGVVESYTQIKDANTGAGTKLKKDMITHLVLIPQSGTPYGISMVKRAYDDIMRDVKVAAASSEAIYRHGFKKYHIQVGTTGEIIDESVMTEISNKFQDIETKNEWVTCRDVDITNVDENGLEQIDKYNDISLSRVCAAIGIPEELLGLRKGSTDATAVSRIKAFYKKIQTFQKFIAQCYNTNVIDRKTGKPGSVKVVFNDPDPSDESIKANWISEIMKASPADPFTVLPVKWIQAEFNIDSGEWYAPDDLGKGVPGKPKKDTTTVPSK